MAGNLKDGSRAIERLQRSLRDSEGLSNAYAEGVLAEAQRRAAGKPTPQSRMAADAMGVRGSEIAVLSGGDPAAVAYGAEMGSAIYRQFGPRNEGGYWLFPAGESQEAESVGDRYLEGMLDRVVRGF